MAACIKPAGKMQQILITRAAAQGQQTAQELARRGFTARLAPLLTIEVLPFTAPAVLPQAALLTSANALPALEALPRGLPVYTVGFHTAAAVRGAGFTTVHSADGDARALAAVVKAQLGPTAGSLLHLAGDVVGGELTALLSAAGYWVQTEVVYRAHAAPVLPPDIAGDCARGNIDTVLLYSPRSAAIFSRLVGDAPWRERLALYCLSDNVAAAAGTGWKAVSICPQPDEKSLLDSLTALKNTV
jgi:uroporphyrinogen-III synthase